MRQIVKLLPKDRQTMLFSATQTTKARRAGNFAIFFFFFPTNKEKKKI